MVKRATRLSDESGQSRDAANDRSIASLVGLWSQRDPVRSASDSVHRTLREAILSGVLSPGSKLGEEELARRLDVSRTPVREAILRLETERLAERAPGRGLAVAAITHEEILELYVVRSVIDGLAARLAGESAGTSDIAALKWIDTQMRDTRASNAWSEMASLNLEFHEALGRSGHNQVLVDILLTLHDRVRRFPGTTFSVGERADSALREHAAIIRAVEGRDGALAEDLARRHMTAAMETRIAMLFPSSRPREAV